MGKKKMFKIDNRKKELVPVYTRKTAIMPKYNPYQTGHGVYREKKDRPRQKHWSADMDI